MVTLVTTLIECRARAAATADTATIGAAAATRSPGAQAATERKAATEPRADVRTELLGALSDAQRQAQGRGVRLEVAAPHGLTLGVQPAMLRPLLLALLRAAIEHASDPHTPGAGTPGGHVFAGAMRVDREVRIVITDDGRRASEPLTTEAHASLARLLALSDASLLVDDHPGDGTTMMLCLPDMG
jgi:hypothetical protein